MRYARCQSLGAGEEQGDFAVRGARPEERTKTMLGLAREDSAQ